MRLSLPDLVCMLSYIMCGTAHFLFIHYKCTLVTYSTYLLVLTYTYGIAQPVSITCTFYASEENQYAVCEAISAFRSISFVYKKNVLFAFGKLQTFYLLSPCN